MADYGSCSMLWGAGNQQVRNVMVEVTNDDLERALRKMKRRLKVDNGIKLLRERQSFRKPSELKVLARKERDKRIAKKAFRAKLKWIQARQARYDNIFFLLSPCNISEFGHRSESMYQQNQEYLKVEHIKFIHFYFH